MAQTRTKTTLSQSHPELAAQWHPTKNGGLPPEQVVAGSNKKAWWKCSQGPDHEWEVPLRQRMDGSGCPFCLGRRGSSTNSVASLNPQLASQWHSTKNSDMTADDLPIGSHKKVWWKCPEGPDHEWPTTPSKRQAQGCPFCGSRRLSVNNS